MPISVCPIGLMRLEGSTQGFVTAASQMVAPVNGFFKTTGLPENGLIVLLTSPAASAAVGAKLTISEPGDTWRNFSMLKKKNALFLMIGPPTVPPYWLKR